MRTVYLASSLHEAQLFVDLLEEQGIATYVKHAHLQGALGELPLTARPMVCVVNDAHYLQGRELAGQFERANREDPGPDRHCNSCGEDSPGNFQMCWKCRADFEAERVS